MSSDQAVLPGVGPGVLDIMDVVKKGRQKPEGSGRKKGSLNKFIRINMEDIYSSFAKEAGIPVCSVNATRFHLCVMHDKPELIGLNPKERIPLAMRQRSAECLLPFELPKKRALQVNLDSNNDNVRFVISTNVKEDKEDYDNEHEHENENDNEDENDNESNNESDNEEIKETNEEQIKRAQQETMQYEIISKKKELELLNKRIIGY